MRLRENPDAPWPTDRLLETSRVSPDSETDGILLAQIFSRLPLVEALSVFSRRCLFMETETILSEFWEQ
jgi:hypothetical protein